MNHLDTGKDKIKKICDLLKEETLDPAKHEAQELIQAAEHKARQIVHEAEQKAEALLNDAAQKREKQRDLFLSSLKQASEQGLEAIKQAIQKRLFSEHLPKWLAEQTRDPKVSARLISVLIEAVDKEGTSADFSALIAATLSPEEVNGQLAQSIVDRLKEGGVVLGEFEGGVQLKIHDRNLILDFSEEALKELVGRYIRKNFRELFFQV